MQNVLTMILAGGRGARLEPLTRDRAKPAVPFGGYYRIIDFVLSNCINSGLRKIVVLTQYKAASLDRHINMGWRFLYRDFGEYIDIIPPQQRVDENWYRGTADAIYQNIYSIEKEKPTHVLILGGDHIYKMNYEPMIKFHIEKGADLTVATLPVSLEDGTRFGIVRADESGRINRSDEKPSNPAPMPDDPTKALASMGIYVFNTSVMYEMLCEDAVRTDTHHDFGRNIIPRMIDSSRVFSYPFQDENKKEAAYWRDVGTLHDFYSANMDLIQTDPFLNLYDSSWPIRTVHDQEPPCKFVFAERGESASVRRGEALQSMVCAGSIISGGRVERSVLGRKVRVNSYATVEDSLLFDRVNIGRHAKIRRAIIDKDVEIPPGMEIGYDLDADRARGFTVTEQGLVVIAKSERVPPDRPRQD